MDLTPVIPRLQSFEGCEPHMYLCTGGKVTIGIGHAIETPADAVGLPWSINGRPATDTEVQTDYASIAAARMDLTAPAYAHLTQCRMSPDDINVLVAADVARFEAKLAAALPNWSTYPEPVQQALFDMGFNLGVDGLLKFHMLLAAVDAGQWAEAAAQCHRKGIGDARNQQTAALFLQAAG
jgi:GH24 family phage-related lysozyme (muramidase)